MHLDHFGLAVNPFGLSPKLDFLFKSGAFEESMAHLVYGVENSEAIIMITGAIGTGKTMSLQSFLTHLTPSFKSALVTNTQVDEIGLLKLILEDLEIDFSHWCDKSDLLIRFKLFLLEASRQGQRVIIVIDEAQNLKPEVLEEVRLLTNLGQGEIQPVQVVLVGQPELETLVNQRALAQLRQRIRVHYRLVTLSRKEVEDYLNHRMSVAGCRQHVFQSAAIDRIFQFSGGVPRLVNSLAGNALLSAFVASRSRISPADIEPLGGVSPPSQQTPTPPPSPAPPALEMQAEAGKEAPPKKGLEKSENSKGGWRKVIKRRPMFGLLAAMLAAALVALLLIGHPFGTSLGLFGGGVSEGPDQLSSSSVEDLADSGENEALGVEDADSHSPPIQ